MKKGNSYWMRRIEKQMTSIADTSADELDAALIREYRRVYKDLKNYLIDLYSVSGKPHVLDNN